VQSAFSATGFIITQVLWLIPNTARDHNRLQGTTLMTCQIPQETTVIPDLVDNLCSSQHTKADSAICGRGNFSLSESRVSSSCRRWLEIDDWGPAAACSVDSLQPDTACGCWDNAIDVHRRQPDWSPARNWEEDDAREQTAPPCRISGLHYNFVLLSLHRVIR